MGEHHRRGPVSAPGPPAPDRPDAGNARLAADRRHADGRLPDPGGRGPARHRPVLRHRDHGSGRHGRGRGLRTVEGPVARTVRPAHERRRAAARRVRPARPHLMARPRTLRRSDGGGPRLREGHGCGGQGEVRGGERARRDAARPVPRPRQGGLFHARRARKGTRGGTPPARKDGRLYFVKSVFRV